jgi:hypothetical protein
LDFHLSVAVAPQLDAIRQGLSTMVPQRLLALFGWQQVRLLVTGKPFVDLVLLKAICNCSYRTEPRYTWFWEVMEELTDDQRALFLRFVWGRETLPASRAEVSQQFYLGDGSSIDTLPRAGTCGFALYLPRYSNKETLKRMLTIAITATSVIAD